MCPQVIRGIATSASHPRSPKWHFGIGFELVSHRPRFDSWAPVAWMTWSICREVSLFVPLRRLFADELQRLRFGPQAAHRRGCRAAPPWACRAAPPLAKAAAGGKRGTTMESLLLVL